MIFLVYFIIIIFSNSIGAVSGMGGGVIIKPLFDLIGYHTLTEITFYSSVAVFTMSISSTYKQIQNKVQINWYKAFSVSLGSLLGGILGNYLFSFLVTYLTDDTKVQRIQIVLTLISLLLVLIYTLWLDKKYYLKSLISYFFVGLVLGTFSTLLGIGGGPINVTLLIVCFGLSMKTATVYSIITIFFSQLSKLISVGVETGFNSFDLRILFVVVSAALIGGYLGGIFSKNLSEKIVSNLFIGVVLFVMGINFYNLF